MARLFVAVWPSDDAVDALTARLRGLGVNGTADVTRLFTMSIADLLDELSQDDALTPARGAARHNRPTEVVHRQVGRPP